MGTAKKQKKDIKKETPSKPPARAAKYEKEEAEHEDGAPLQIPDKKKKSRATGIVAIKHKKVYETLTKNLGKSSKKISIEEAMIAQGYSPSYARAAQLKNTKTWQKLMDEYLPDELLSTTHHELIIARKLDYMLFTAEIDDASIYELLASVGCTPKKIIHGMQGVHVWFFVADNKIRKDATELAYKIKAKMSPELIEIKTPLQKMSDAELAAVIAKQTKRLTKKD